MLNIYKASAGSGKTFTLAGDYIRLILGRKRDDGNMELNPNPSGAHRSILAITFTNKATEEMKTRIIHELAVIADMEPGWKGGSDHASRLTAEFGCTREQLRKSAEIALRSILYDFSRFNISTIDAFFQSILRTFAHEVELPGNYELELDDRFVVATGVNNMLSSFNLGEDYPSDPGNRRLEAWISAFLHSEMREGKSFNIFNRQLDIHGKMIDLISGFLNEEYNEHLDQFNSYFAEPDRIVRLSEALRSRLGSVRDEVRRTVSDVTDACATHSLEMKTNESRLLARGTVGAARKTADALAQDGTKAFPVKVSTSDAAIAVAPFVERAAKAIIRCDIESKIILGLRGNLFVLGLLGRVIHYMSDFTRENSSLLLKDTNTILRKIIADDPVPFIYERVGVNLNHFLIDEFQDTSRMQWENLKPLLDESLGFGHDNLVIGDEKQSIYRFRNADPTLLGNLHESFSGNSRITGSDISGNTNWRSASDIVRFNNSFYSILSHDLDLGEVYANVVQQVSPKHAGHRGYVKFTPFASSEEITAEEAAFDICIAEIRRQLKSGYRPCDIAVLFRKRKVAAKFISRLMSVHDSDTTFPRVSVLSDDSLLLFSSPAVRQVVSTMRLLAASDHVYDRRNVSMKVIARVHSHFEAAVNSGLSPSEALRAAVASRDETPGIKGLATASKAEGSTLQGVVKILIDELDPERRKNENAYLTALMDLVTDFASHGAHDLRSFVNWLDTGNAMNATISPGADTNAIRVLTIHKAKGLDFKCVHLPYLDGKTKPSGPKWFKPAGNGGETLLGLDPELLPPLVPLVPASWMEETVLADRYRRLKRENLLDAVNVLYVGFTRAVDELIIGINNNDSSPEGSGLIIPILEKLTEQDITDRLASGLLHNPEGKSGTPETVPFTRLTKNADGSYTAGAPTNAPESEKKTSRTALEPTSTIPMPPMARHVHPSLWNDTSVNDDGKVPRSLSTEELIRFYAGKIETLRDLKPALDRDVNAGRIEAETALEINSILSQRLTATGTSQWYSDSCRIYRNRILETGNGGTARADRIIIMPDDSVDVVIFTDTTEGNGEETRKKAAFCSSVIRRMGYTKVYGWIWNPASDNAPDRAAFRN